MSHKQFHVPWKCSQCSDSFSTEIELRSHFSKAHQLVHCRLCYFMLPDNDDYHSHLYQKHNVINVARRNDEVLWAAEYDGSPKFQCLLCSKNVMNVDYFKHFMCYHHFTLKCFTSLLSGNDISFKIYGANISQNFLAAQLKEHSKFGYIDLDRKAIEPEPPDVITEEVNTNLLDALIPEIKQEITSDTEEPKIIEEPKRIEEPEVDEETKRITEEILKYRGDEDFDVTLTELVMPQKPYYEYIESVIKDFELNIVHVCSNINYQLINSTNNITMKCTLCVNMYENIQDFVSHMCKMHCLKVVPTFFCRVCMATFDNEIDFKNHCSEEMGEFDDLWLCQFCDKEFINRESTREHLAQHKDKMDLSNCFSPHIGFKCRYCPSLFWNEPDREMHHSEDHYALHKEDFYKCSLCDDVFGDKVCMEFIFFICWW